MSFHQFKRDQLVNASIDKVWEFISNPSNLKKITPPYMGFDITSDGDFNHMYEGMIISYKVSPLLGIKTTWVTEITHVKDKLYFVDEQRVGPYKLWHHQHILEPVGDKTQMTDIVSYEPPFGILGTIANALFIKFKLQEIFDFRTKVVEKMFV